MINNNHRSFNYTSFAFATFFLLTQLVLASGRASRQHRHSSSRHSNNINSHHATAGPNAIHDLAIFLSIFGSCMAGISLLLCFIAYRSRHLEAAENGPQRRNEPQAREAAEYNTSQANVLGIGVDFINKNNPLVSIEDLSESDSIDHIKIKKLEKYAARCIKSEDKQTLILYAALLRKLAAPGLPACVITQEDLREGLIACKRSKDYSFQIDIFKDPGTLDQTIKASGLLPSSRKAMRRSDTQFYKFKIIITYNKKDKTKENRRLVCALLSKLKKQSEVIIRVLNTPVKIANELEETEPAEKTTKPSIKQTSLEGSFSIFSNRLDLDRLNEQVQVDENNNTASLSQIIPYS